MAAAGAPTVSLFSNPLAAETGSRIMVMTSAAAGSSGVRSVRLTPVVVPGGGAAVVRVAARLHCKNDGTATASTNYDGEAFREALEQVRAKYRPIALLDNPRELNEIVITAEDCSKVLMMMVMDRDGSSQLSKEDFEEMISIGTVFIQVKAQCVEGYIQASAMVAAMYGLKRMAELFTGSVKDLPRYAGVVPLSGEDVDKNVYFSEMSRSFIVLLYAVQYGYEEKN